MPAPGPGVGRAPQRAGRDVPQAQRGGAAGRAGVSRLEELEASLPYVKGSKVVAVDEQGDPLYEDIGPTPRFLALSRQYLQRLSEGQKPH